MAKRKSKGPVCQSCAMPLEKPEQFGTGEGGVRSGKYCHYCYRDGKFTQPDITMQGMVDMCVTMMVQREVMPEAEARALMSRAIPKLKRWQKP